jgi:hypothetical protein
MPFFNALSFVLAQQLAANAEGITDPARQTFYGVLGGVLGSSPVGLGLTLALANQEAQRNPPAAQPLKPLTITSRQFLPPAVDGQPYQTALTATGGTPPYTWTTSATLLPQGGKNVSLAANGVISGTPDTKGVDDGSFPLTVQVTDSTQPTPATQMQLFLLTVGQPGASLQKAIKP